ncbi:CAP domain-containing protein [Methylomicrobium sp. Wu6]|uniref:CAP domain-containing protein n=1 Tax=Methylomicrobium sp. Wu6 TaxID=3107928 RepID=UPI002DD66F56|nr:CAP domain-containing protein [Methylomicrobium sp. Wu6]MEC4748020.1 CAP domain-containing protein [Methylomicrobium sp. Wu6]
MQKIFLTSILWLGTVQFASAVGADSPPPINSNELERQIHQQINWIRQNHGLPPLNAEEQLTTVARKHSQDMASHHFFNHVNLRGEYPSDRAKRQGWDKKKQIDATTLATGVAENIFLARLYDKIVTTKQNGITVKKDYEWIAPNRLVQTIVQGWMDSPHHRKVMLSPQYDRQGIGVVVSEYDVYVTENLF